VLIFLYIFKLRVKIKESVVLDVGVGCLVLVCGIWCRHGVLDVGVGYVLLA